ncbi:MAG: hypothetical protein IJF78_07710 [Clostridia bacterium]|nr:hypothetical protein [Clostridia bacterium]
MKKSNMTHLIILGTVPLIGTTERVSAALKAALVLFAVILLASLAASLTRRMVTGRVRLLADAAVIGALTTAAVLILRAIFPDMAEIAAFLSVTAGNVLVYYISETSAENGIKASVKNIITAGAAGAAMLICTAMVRELMTFGTLFSGFGAGDGIRVFSDWFTAVDFAGTQAGALILFGLTAAVAQKIAKNVRVRQNEHGLKSEMIAEGCHPDLVLDSVTGKVVRRTTAELLKQHRHPDEEENTNKADAENDEANDENAEVES